MKDADRVHLSGSQPFLRVNALGRRAEVFFQFSELVIHHFRPLTNQLIPALRRYFTVLSSMPNFTASSA